MKVRLLGSVGIGGKFYSAGDVVDVDKVLAQNLFHRNKAEVFVSDDIQNQPAQEPQEAPKVEEQEESSQEEQENSPEGFEEKEQEESPEDAESEGAEYITKIYIEEESPEEEEQENFPEYSFEQLKEMAAECGIKFNDSVEYDCLFEQVKRHLAENA